MTILLVTVLCVLVTTSNGQQNPNGQGTQPRGNDPLSVIIAIPPPPGKNSAKNRILVLPSSNSIVRWAGDSRGKVAVDQQVTSLKQQTGTPVRPSNQGSDPNAFKDSFGPRPSTAWASGQKHSPDHPSISQGKIPSFWAQPTNQNGGSRSQGSVDGPGSSISGSVQQQAQPASQNTAGQQISQNAARQGPQISGQQQQPSQNTGPQQRSQNTGQQSGPAQGWTVTRDQPSAGNTGRQYAGNKVRQTSWGNVPQQRGTENTAQQPSAGNAPRQDVSGNGFQQTAWRNRGQQRPGSANAGGGSRTNDQPPVDANPGSIFFNPESRTNGAPQANGPAGSAAKPLSRSNGANNRQPTMPLQTVAEPSAVLRNRPVFFVPAASVFVPQGNGPASDPQPGSPNTVDNNNQSPVSSPVRGQPEMPPPAPVDKPVVRGRPTPVMSGRIEYIGNVNVGSLPPLTVDGASSGNQQTGGARNQPAPGPNLTPINRQPIVSTGNNQPASASAPNVPPPKPSSARNPNPNPQTGNVQQNQANRPPAQPQPNAPALPALPNVNTRAGATAGANPNGKQTPPVDNATPVFPNVPRERGNQPPNIPARNNIQNQRSVGAPQRRNTNTGNTNVLPRNPSLNRGATGPGSLRPNVPQPPSSISNSQLNPNQLQNGGLLTGPAMTNADAQAQLNNLLSSFPAGMDGQLILNRIAQQFAQGRMNQLIGTDTEPTPLSRQNPNLPSGVNARVQPNIPNQAQSIGTPNQGNRFPPTDRQFQPIPPRQPPNPAANVNPPQSAPFPLNNQGILQGNGQRSTLMPSGPQPPMQGRSGSGPGSNQFLFGQSWSVDAAGNRNGPSQRGVFTNQPAGGNGLLLPPVLTNPGITQTTPEPTEGPEVEGPGEVEPTPPPSPAQSIWQRLGLPNAQGTTRPGQLPNVPMWNRPQTSMPIPNQPRTNQGQQQAPPSVGNRRRLPQRPPPNFLQALWAQNPRNRNGVQGSQVRNGATQNQPNANGIPQQAGPFPNAGPNRNNINRPRSPTNVNPGAPRATNPNPVNQQRRPNSPLSQQQGVNNQRNQQQRPNNPPNQQQRTNNQPSQQQRPNNQPSQQNQRPINTRPKPPVQKPVQNPKVQQAWVPPNRARIQQTKPAAQPNPNPRAQPPNNLPNRVRTLPTQTPGQQTITPQQRATTLGGQNQQRSGGMFPGMNPAFNQGLLNQRGNLPNGAANAGMPGMGRMPPHMAGLALQRRYQDQACGPSKILQRNYQRQYMQFLAAQQQRRQAQMAMFQRQPGAAGGVGAAGQSPSPMAQNPFMQSMQAMQGMQGGAMGMMPGMMPLVAPESPEINYQCTVSESCGMTTQERAQTIQRSPQSERDCQSRTTGLLCCLG